MFCEPLHADQEQRDGGNSDSGPNGLQLKSAALGKGSLSTERGDCGESTNKQLNQQKI
jgi:hypothetical protein